MISDDIRNKLSSLDAFLAAETDDIDLAIIKLSDHTDPESIRRRITLLLKADRVDDAYSITTTYSPHPEWVEVGIRAAILANDYALAEKFVNNSEMLGDSSGTMRLRSIVAFTDSLISKHFLFHSSTNHPIAICAVEPEILPALQKGVDFLLPYCEEIYKRHSISSPLEREAITILQICLSFLGRSDETRRFLPMLIKKGNINVLLGQFVAEEKLPVIGGFSDALIESNPNDFYALLFAEMIRYASDNDHKSAFTSLVSLTTLADDKDKRALIFSALSHISIQGGAFFIKELEGLTDSLLDLENPEHSTRLAIHKINHKCWDDAEIILNKNPLLDSPQWLRASAKCDIAKGALNKGLPKLITSALMYKDEAWLLEAADHAFQQEKYADAIHCLECSRDYYPWNSYARKNLVTILIKEDLLDKAILESEHLNKYLPNDNQLLVQLAYLYNRADKTDKAITILTDLNKSGAASLDTILLLSSILRQAIGPVEGFEILEKNKEKYWEHKEFLFAYLDMGYASGNENQANESLQALEVLRQKGEIDPKLFRIASLDEITEVVKESKDRRKNIDAAILQGKMPWTMSAQLTYKTIYYDWKIRTQKLKWLAEDTASRAELSVYFTNGFGADITDEQAQLGEIRQTKTRSSICVDYSALITLHELGKLPLLFSIYENVYMSEKYRSSIQEDRQRIQPHQLSHSKGYEQIRYFIDSGNVSIVSNEDMAKYIVIDEYINDKDDQSQTVRPLKPVIDCLSLSGKIQKSKEEELRELASRADIDNAEQISVNDQIVIELNTLMTLYREDLLEIIVNSFRVHITEDDNNDLVRDIHGFNFQRKTLDQYNKLWDEVFRHPNVQYVSVPSGNDENERGVALLSLKISEEKALPLLADDRVLQSVIINARGSSDGTAFGTDVFLLCALKNEQIEISDYANSVVQLMKWRYRFIVPEAQMLHYLATCYTGVSPGEELSIIAEYLHDCMRDPGLFGGLENTDPPISIALKLYITWASRIGEFLALVWTDTSITDQRSNAITDWVALIMLPSVPVVIQEQLHSRLASNLAEILVVNALIRASEKQPHQRVSASLRNLSSKIGISDHRHEQLISEVISRAAG